MKWPLHTQKKHIHTNTRFELSRGVRFGVPQSVGAIVAMNGSVRFSELNFTNCHRLPVLRRSDETRPIKKNTYNGRDEAKNEKSLFVENRLRSGDTVPVWFIGAFIALLCCSLLGRWAFWLFRFCLLEMSR